MTHHHHHHGHRLEFTGYPPPPHPRLSLVPFDCTRKAVLSSMSNSQIITFPMPFNVNLALWHHPSLFQFSLIPTTSPTRVVLGIWSILAYIKISQTSYNLHLLLKNVIICPPTPPLQLPTTPRPPWISCDIVLILLPWAMVQK